MATNSNDALLTPREAAKRLGLTSTTLSIWRCKSGCKRPRSGLVFTRIGRKVFYFASDVENYARAGRVVNPTQRRTA